MEFKDKELIIFDLDGTLINSIPDLTSAVNEMLKHYDLKTLTIEEVTPFVGNGAEPLVRRSLEHTKDTKEISADFLSEALDTYFAAYREITCQDTYLYPGVLETLEKLEAKGYQMVICTNKPFDFIEPILETLSIKNFFEIWIGEDSLPEKKPSATPLNYLSEKMMTPINKSIMIGDSKNDILAAQNAEMESIGVSYGYNYNEHISEYNPTIVVDSFLDLNEIF